MSECSPQRFRHRRASPGPVTDGRRPPVRSVPATAAVLKDSKNEPGAADFYYGEMQMRRRDTATPAAERMILALYWLVSCYGMRAARALAVLAVLVLAPTLGSVRACCLCVGMVRLRLRRAALRGGHPRVRDDASGGRRWNGEAARVVRSDVVRKTLPPHERRWCSVSWVPRRAEGSHTLVAEGDRRGTR